MVRKMKNDYFSRFMLLLKKYNIILHSLWITPVLAVITIVLTAAGHGIVAIYTILYPYSSLLIFICSDANFCGTMGFLQYLIYGILLHIANQKNCFVPALAIIASIHMILMIVALVYFPLGQ